MKNVLLTTTALVAFAGTAFAAGHDAGSPMSFSGETDLGYNDDIENGLFVSSELNVNATVDLGDGIVATLSYGMDVDTSNNGTGLVWDDFPTIEITSPFGSLKAGEMDEEGASEYFYADRDGMSQDVEEQDSDTEMGVRALVNYGSIGVAIGGELLQGSNTLDGLNVGVGATFGNFVFGLGFDEDDAGTLGNPGTAQTVAVSADTTFGAASIGLSYATTDGVEDSIGLAVGYDISADLSVAAYYADNSVADNAYGVSVAYASGAFGIEAYYDGFDGSTNNEYGVDVSYAVNSDINAYVGVFDNGTTEYYVGAEYTINDSISATVSYATADEISGPEFKDGTSVFLTVSF